MLCNEENYLAKLCRINAIHKFCNIVWCRGGSSFFVEGPIPLNQMITRDERRPFVLLEINFKRGKFQSRKPLNIKDEDFGGQPQNSDKVFTPKIFCESVNVGY